MFCKLFYINTIVIILGSISSHDQSPFNERRNSNSNTVPSMNYHLYQMNSNEPPHLSGPPRTVSKEIYENSNSSIPVSKIY
jgi:hypothetical protein